MEEKKPFAVRAALGSAIIPVCTWGVTFALNQLPIDWSKDRVLTGLILVAAFYASGLLLAVAALCGIKKNGLKGILGWAVTGLTLNGLFLLLIAYAFSRIMAP